MPVSSITSLLQLEVEMVGWDSATASAADLESTLSDLESGVEIDISFNAEAVPFDDIPEDVPVEVSTTETPEGKEIREGISFLAGVKAIEIAMNIAGNVFEFVKDLGEVTVGGFLDVEDAVARINAQTGTAIPDLDQLIRDLQAADLGDSVEQIADVAIHAQQIGAPMREAAEAALTFTHTFDENPETVLDSLNTLVTTKLTPNLQDAADLMTVFFQQGGNVGGDALAVVNSNAQSWADMGLTAGEALSTIDSLQQGTGATATEAAKMLQTFDDALTAATADPASQQAQMLKLMKIDNPKDAGEAIGAETIDGFATAFANLPSDQQDLVSGLFFGKGGKKFTGAIEGMTTQGGMFQNVTDAAALAATEIDNSLRGAIDDFVLEINTSIARLLSSDELDLPGKIAALKEAFQAAATTLAEGGSIGDALSVGFHIEGVDTALTNIERVFGNLLIGILEAVAFIQDPTGTNDNDAGTRAEIARLSEGQFAFDIKVANADEIGGLVSGAIGRGVDESKLGELAGQSVQEFLASGEIEKAQALLNALNDTAAAVVAPGLDAGTQFAAQAILDKGDIDLINAALEAGILIRPKVDTEGLQADIDAAIEAAKPSAVTDGWWNNLKPPTDFDSLKTTSGASGAKGTNWWETISVSPETIASLDTADEAVVTLDKDVNTAMTNASLVTGLASDSMILALSAMSDGFISAEEAVALADAGMANSITGNTMTASFDAMSISAALNAEATKASFMDVLATVSLVDVRLTTFFNGVMAKVNAVNDAITNIGLVPPTGGGSTTNNNIVVNNNNNVDGGAGATALGYELGRQVRGMT